MRALLSALLSFILLQAAQAIDWDKHCEDKYFCLTSFVWCERSNDDGNCDYPEDIFPWRVDSNVGHAALLWSTEYEITWRDTDENYPVLLEWRINKDQSEDPDPNVYIWQKNFTNGETSFSFEFDGLAQEMVDDDSDIDIMAVKGRAARMAGSGIQISQPGREYDNVDVEDSSDVVDYSDWFMILDSMAGDYLSEQRKLGRDQEFKKWRLGVGVGVGIGVPIFMAAAFGSGFFMGKGRGRKSTGVGNKIEQ